MFNCTAIFLSLFQRWPIVFNMENCRDAIRQRHKNIFSHGFEDSILKYFWFQTCEILPLVTEIRVYHMYASVVELDLSCVYIQLALFFKIH